MTRSREAFEDLPLQSWADQIQSAGDALADHRGPLVGDDVAFVVGRTQAELLILAGQARRLERLLRRAVLR